MSDRPILQSVPWVSFCMTTRRRPDFLSKTLRSIQQQTFSDFEVIISDNDPAGSAQEVVAGFRDQRFRYEKNETDLGMNASFNRSLSKARGEFVVMITDDDPIYPEMLESLKILAKGHPGFGAYFGGCDVLQQNPVIAGFTLHKVGRNSCLAPLPWGTVRTFSAQEFPYAFFRGDLEMYFLWSVGIVKREIAQAVGGLPNYGSPYLGDFAYTVSACSHSGCAVINQSFGCQTVHDSNFGRKECGELKIAALGFREYMRDRFSPRSDWNRLQPTIERFIGKWVVLHAIFLKQYFHHYKISDAPLRAILKEVFAIPFIGRFRRYYYLGRLFVWGQRLQIALRSFVLNKMQRSR